MEQPCPARFMSYPKTFWCRQSRSTFMLTPCTPAMLRRTVGIDAAQRGVPLSSSAALSTAVTKWQAQTTAIFGRMADHSDGLRAGASAYQQADTDSGAAIDTAGERMTELDLGL